MAGWEEGLGYWLRWQVAVCALIIAAPAVGAAAVILRTRPDPLRPADLWAPCYRNLHPLWLLAYRALVVVVMCSLLYHILLLFGAAAFYFYTMWTFALVIIYFVIATLISAHGCWIYSKQKVHEREAAKGPIRSYNKRGENEQEVGFWGYMMQIAYQTSAGAVMLTDIVFWGLLLPFMSSEQFSLTLVITSMHSLNAVFLLLDTFLNRLPFPWFRMAYFAFWSCIYIIFHWILHASGFSWWPYPFLELATPWAPLWYLSMALVHVPCYGLYYMIVKAKNSHFPKVFSYAHSKTNE